MTIHAVRFDAFVSQAVPWPVMLEDVRYLEQLGFGTAWVGDHYVFPPNPAAFAREAWTTLGALAAQTTRIRLGTAICNVSTRHPALLAKQAATVDGISGGRLDLGLGPGYYAQEHAWLGIPFLAPAGRVDRLREAVEVIDGLMRNPPLTYHGKFYHLDAAPFVPAPVQQPRPPLFIAASGKRALQVVAQHAEGWITLGNEGEDVEASLAGLRARNRMLDEHCAATGRDPATVVRAYLASWSEEFPFVSRQAFQDFVGRYREAGAQRFIFLFVSAGRGAAAVAEGRFPNRETLELFAADAMAGLQGLSIGT